MTQVAATGYVPDDLLWARDAFGTAHLGIDPWGNLVVSPATAQHERAIAQLLYILHGAVAGTPRRVFTGLGFRAPGGSGYLDIPDAVVLPTLSGVDHDHHLLEAPLLVVEVASPSTRVIDRTRKADDYALVGSAAYLLVDLPGLAPVAVPTLELRRPAREAERTTEALTIAVEGWTVVVDPSLFADLG